MADRGALSPPRVCGLGYRASGGPSPASESPVRADMCRARFLSARQPEAGAAQAPSRPESVELRRPGQPEPCPDCGEPVDSAASHFSSTLHQMALARRRPAFDDGSAPAPPAPGQPEAPAPPAPGQPEAPAPPAPGQPEAPAPPAPGQPEAADDGSAPAPPAPGQLEPCPDCGEPVDPAAPAGAHFSSTLHQMALARRRPAFDDDSAPAPPAPGQLEAADDGSAPAPPAPGQLEPCPDCGEPVDPAAPAGAHFSSTLHQMALARRRPAVRQRTRLPASNVGRQMLERMGWREEDGGLGARRQGIVEPLRPRVKRDRRGVCVSREPPRAKKEEEKKKKKKKRPPMDPAKRQRMERERDRRIRLELSDREVPAGLEGLLQ